jgi:hypothetical protein
MASKVAAVAARQSAHIFVSGRGENAIVRIAAPGKLGPAQH